MGDIFSEGVDGIWRSRVFGYIKNHPEANFLLLSKRPDLFIPWIGFISKENTFIGTSLDYAHNGKRLLPIKRMGMSGYRTFVNIEPLMSRMDMVDFSGIDFIIVGALTGRKYIAHKEWHESIKHPVIYYKNNYIQYFPELRQTL
jgi:protein gp37